MLTVVFLVCYCVVLLIYLRGKKRKFASTPNLAGGIPILGNVNVIPKDSTQAWDVVSAISKESLRGGQNVLLSYGPMYLLVLTDPDDSAAILNSSAAEKHYVYNFGKPWIGNGLITSPNSIWYNHRKIMYPMFSQKVLNGYMGVFNRQSARLVRSFADEVGKGPFDHRRYLALNGLETVCQTALGIDLGDQNISQNKAYIEAVCELATGLITRFTSPWLHNELLYGWSTLKKKQQKYINVVHSMTQQVIANRKKKLSESKNDLNQPDVLQPLIDRMLNVSANKGLSDDEIREQLDTVVVAGYDTSALELIFTLMLLGTYGDVQDKVYKEIQEVFEDSNRDVDKDDLPKLVYIDAVLKESLRLYPVVPLVARQNTREIQLKNCTVPTNTHCIISVYGINRHPSWGPDAEQFRPERWLDPACLPSNPNAFASFGLGKRSCIGKTYFMMAMKTSLVHVLRRYKVTSDVTKLVLKMDPALRPASGQHISVELR